MTDIAVVINGAGTRFTLIEPVRFDEEGVTVPAGYACDFASVPRICWSFGFTPLGRHQRAALLHDYLYDIHHWRGTGTRKEADAAFLRQMRRDGVGWRSRWTMYLAVRAFGWLYWRERWSTQR